MDDRKTKRLLKLAKEGDSLHKVATRDEVCILIDEGLVTTRRSGILVDTAPAEPSTGKFHNAETPIEMITGLTAEGEKRLQELMQED